MTGEQSLSFHIGEDAVKTKKKGTCAKATGDYSKDVFNSMQAAIDYSRLMRVQMPILFSVDHVVSGKRRASDAAKRLVDAGFGSEIDITLDHSALNLPIPTMAPKGGKGKE